MATLSKDPNALHEHLAATLEGALGRPLPQLQVQFRHLSVTAQVVVSDANAQTTELPTLVNTIKRAAAGIVAKRHVVEKHILRDVTGRFKPGTMTLILGQPGSGKSTLMKILSGRLHETKSVQVEGDISYNGRPIDDIRTKIPQLVSYVEQHDTHFPTLSVNETLQFAHEFTGSEYYRRGQELLAHGTADENATAVKTVEELEKAYPDLVVQHLGLQNCQNTWIGDAMTRGVSGGERKRVTTGEMAFGLKYVSLMDEISTGLDSAATFDIVYSQREIARKMRRAVVISLLQPSPEVFDLFDDVMILNAGHVMYYGPRSEAESYFAELGFPCPTGRDVADFLLDLGTKEQLKYEFQQDDRRTVNFGRLPRFPSEFAESYRQSRVFQALVDDMDSEKESQSIDAVNEHIDRMPEFHQSLWENTLTLIRRETMLSIRNTAFIRGRATMVIVMGLIYGSLYYQTDFTNIQVVLGVLFSSVMFLMLGQTAQISTFVDARAVFYKQRSSNFTRTAAYTIASCVRQLPLAITEAVVFGAFIYWMVGLESSVERFLIFEALFALTILVYVGWFFFIASIAPDRHILFPIAMISIVFFILFTGFVMPKGQIPDYMIWIYWMDPLAWVIRALAVNEYRWGDLSTCVFDGVDYCAQFGMTSGEYYLSLFGVPSGKQWVAYAVIYLVVAYVLCMGLAWFALEYIRYDTPESAAAAAEAGMEEAKSQEGYSSAETPRSNDRSSTVIPISSQSAACVPVTLAFRDLHYTVPAPDHPNESIELLKGISGYALPGTITALMGSTGAGKTTLMDVIAGRKTGGTIDGKILLNGYEATPLAIQRSTGYCEQMDIHSEAATFREALTFSAFLRQDSSVPASTKFEAVEECLELLDLMPIADKIIRGSSTEQMKRLTIGVELAAQPSVLFLDEPTSGLDARSAKLIMDGVRKVADTGRTIVCTIHQPSAEVFKVFDNLLLLKLGGETVYFGKLGRKCHALIEYFEAIPGVTKIREGYNPATWMLECIGAGVAHSHGASDKEADFVDRFQRSDLMVRLDAMLDKDGIGRPAPDTPELLFAKKRAASSVVQMQFLVRRFVDMYWRTPSYNLTRFGIYLVLAVLFGIMFLPTEYETYQGINAGLGIVSMTVIFTGFMSFNSVLPIAIDDRAAFYRERASQTYSALWYFVGSTLVEIPYVFLCGLLFTAIFFPMVGFTGWSTWALYWLNTSLLMLQQTYLGQLLAYTMPTLEVAALLGAALNSTLMMFIGFNPPATSIPRGYKWLYTITPQHYSMSILGALVFADCDDEPIFNATLGEYVGGGSALGCQPLSGVPLTIGHSTVKEFVEGNFKIKHDEIWMNFGITIAFTIAFRLLALVALRFVNHQKK